MKSTCAPVLTILFSPDGIKVCYAACHECKKGCNR